ncbi:MAG: type II CRISPR-associated endonuclease Cas1 [Methyloprofundus sp.]|nr:type II CRISPR-associated endonuclease Cas1 [Methyloprofundus sp.]
MGWRSVLISQPAHLSYKNLALQIKQDQGQAQVMLEDIAAIVLDNLQITLSAQLLSACAQCNIAVITVDDTHLPNGVLHGFLPHSRALKVMQAQLGMSRPQQKRLWQTLIQQKIINQASALTALGQTTACHQLYTFARQVKSGDPDNYEAQAAQLYFKTLFGKGFQRRDESLVNAALNYSYSLVRSALARSLVAYGFLPAFGLQHHNEQNAFNLADDLIEPYRPHIDYWVIQALADIDPQTSDLTTAIKAQLVNFLHQDLPRIENNQPQGKSTLLALVEASVISLSQTINQQAEQPPGLVLPGAIEL